MAIRVDEPMPFAGVACSGLRAAKGIGLVVHFAVVLPTAEFAWSINDHACHGSGVACLDAAALLRLCLNSRAKVELAGHSMFGWLPIVDLATAIKFWSKRR